MQKPTLKKDGLYFLAPSESVQFINSGCAILDCVLGGGWPLGRVVNIVGDKSTGKTLLAMEAMANFQRMYKGGKSFYVESEAAFDKSYAAALGVDFKQIEVTNEVDTVEQFFNHLTKTAKSLAGKPAIYILDSLDALSDQSETNREIGDNTYGTQKARKMSEVFRRTVRLLQHHNICLIIISQVRDNIGVTFGARYTRSGGKALDFYSSQIVWLANIKTLKKVIAKIERPVGIEVKAKCTKNKIGMPLRDCVFRIRFGYGIDDIQANLDWLDSVGRLSDTNISKTEIGKLSNEIGNMDKESAQALRESLTDIVKKVWYEIESGFLPKKGKYQ